VGEHRLAAVREGDVDQRDPALSAPTAPRQALVLHLDRACPSPRRSGRPPAGRPSA
jgi:hypothetical protein